MKKRSNILHCVISFVFDIGQIEGHISINHWDAGWKRVLKIETLTINKTRPPLELSLNSTLVQNLLILILQVRSNVCRCRCWVVI